MAAYEINLKKRINFKIEQKKIYNHVGRIYPTLFWNHKREPFKIRGLEKAKCIYAF